MEVAVAEAAEAEAVVEDKTAATMQTLALLEVPSQRVPSARFARSMAMKHQDVGTGMMMIKKKINRTTRLLVRLLLGMAMIQTGTLIAGHPIMSLKNLKS